MLKGDFLERIAHEVSSSPTQVAATIELLDQGGTISFIARYRKDVTGNLDEVRLETIARLNKHYSLLAQRRTTILEATAKQGKLTDELRARVETCLDKPGLEDLYLPYKRPRHTKAAIAREKGLGPLADFLWAQVLGEQSIEEFTATFVRQDRAVLSVEEALEGAGYILAERISVDSQARAAIRERMFTTGKIVVRATKNTVGRKNKFEAYYDFSESVPQMPSHRFLAITRGVKDGALRMDLKIDDDSMVTELAARYIKDPGSVFEPYIRQALEDAYNRLLLPSLETEVIGIVRRRADSEAIRAYCENAESLLLAAPAGPVNAVGIYPDPRGGWQVAVADGSGRFLESATIAPDSLDKDTENVERTLLELMQKHDAYAVAIGNGAGGRETANFVRKALAKLGRAGAFCVRVNGSGASIYARSKTAREELPDLAAGVRGALSIARRLQDPLAEMVKTDPRHIGIGQYQHDVSQKQLREDLHGTVTSCVNKVGVNLNTASAALLRYVSGISFDIAKEIVAYRSQVGRFRSREQLKEVKSITPDVFEQCAGFLRVTDGENPLDARSIHPEAYPVVERMAATLGVTVSDLIQNPRALKGMDLSPFGTEIIGPLTLRDIGSELLKPGRDPRPRFRVPRFLDGVQSVADLQQGMEMEGVVTNVTDFGAFIDIGIQQDGLVHLSELANRFVKQPHAVVRVGDIVRVKVIKVDKELPRISLSMKVRQHTAERTDRHKRAKRRPGPKAADAKVQPGGRPEAAYGQASAREEPRKPRRDTRQPATRKKTPPRRRKAATRSGRSEDTASINTLLADQLAALKEKLGS